jgi:hypothetical protein
VTHTQVVIVIPSKTILRYGGVDASNLFPLQVRRLLHLLAPFLTIFADQRTLQWCFCFGQSVGPT